MAKIPRKTASQPLLERKRGLLTAQYVPHAVVLLEPTKLAIMQDRLVVRSR